MPVVSGIDQERLEKAIAKPLIDAMGDEVNVRWDSDFPREDMPALGLSWTIPPAPRAVPSEKLSRVPGSGIVTLSGPTNGKVFRLFVNHYPVDVTANGNLANLRDAFVAAINAASYPVPVTAFDRPADGELRVSADSLGDLRYLRGLPSTDVSVTFETHSNVRDLHQPCAAMITLSARTQPRKSPFAQSIIDAAKAVLTRRSTLRQLGWHAIGVGGVFLNDRTLPSLQGTEQEDRVETDMRIFVESVVAEAVDTIQTVTVDRSVENADKTVQITL